MSESIYDQVDHEARADWLDCREDYRDPFDLFSDKCDELGLDPMSPFSRYIVEDLSDHTHGETETIPLQDPIFPICSSSFSSKWFL